MLALVAVVCAGCRASDRESASDGQAAQTPTDSSEQTATRFASAKKTRGLTLPDIPFNGERAYGYLKQICDLGPRISGTQGMQKQQSLLIEHFKALGGRVVKQSFRIRHPETGQPVEMTNLIVQWNPRSKERILLCTHYDTRPFPDKDSHNKRGIFLGANDGASGTALMMEMAHSMPKLKCNYGVDFVLFDGEELIYDDDRDRYFLGSRFFANNYVRRRHEHRYKWAVLLDMIGDADLQIYFETNSMKSNSTRSLCKSIWKVASDLKVKEFIPRRKYTVRDDHLALNNVAKIPSIDIIDFDYPNPRKSKAFWHTMQDVPKNCSALSLAKVGWVMEEWLRRVQ